MMKIPLSIKIKPGGLDLSQSCLDLESQRCQRVRLDSRENLDSVKKCVSTVEKSQLRSTL